MEDPYPHLAEIREHDPVHMIVDRWGVFRYDDVFNLLRDPALSVDDANSDHEDGERIKLFESHLEEGEELEQDTSMLNVDPPDHTRLRRLVSKAFTPKTIEDLRPRTQELVDEALDRIEAEGSGDVVTELAFTLPFDIISEMLGMPEADKNQIRVWSENIVKTLDPIISDDDVALAMSSSRAMNKHLDQVILWKRENPGDDLLTKLIEAEEDGDRLTAVELRDQVGLLFIAGHETTVNLIGTGIHTLMQNPEQAARWRNDDSLAANAVDELLRYVTPVQMSRRIATTDLEFGDKTIANKSFIFAVLASANRDPEKFGPTAHELDLGRPDAGQHVSFGSGAHYCLGSSLAKLEAQVAIGTFITRFPNAKPSGSHTWNGRLNLRGLEHLPVSV